MLACNLADYLFISITMLKPRWCKHQRKVACIQDLSTGLNTFWLLKLPACSSHLWGLVNRKFHFCSEEERMRKRLKEIERARRFRDRELNPKVTSLITQGRFRIFRVGLCCSQISKIIIQIKNDLHVFPTFKEGLGFTATSRLAYNHREKK